MTLACPLHNYGAILSLDHAHPTTPVPLPVHCKLFLSVQHRHFKRLPTLFGRGSVVARSWLGIAPFLAQSARTARYWFLSSTVSQPSASLEAQARTLAV